jgi:hypothetical protein
MRATAPAVARAGGIRYGCVDNEPFRLGELLVKGFAHHNKITLLKS